VILSVQYLTFSLILVHGLRTEPTERSHLLGILNSVIPTPISYHVDDIMEDSSDKVQSLVTLLLNEKLETEGRGEMYSCPIFVQHRDSVIALTEVLKNHPFTANVLRAGIPLGVSDSSKLRHCLSHFVWTHIYTELTYYTPQSSAPLG